MISYTRDTSETEKSHPEFFLPTDHNHKPNHALSTILKKSARTHLLQLT